MTFANIKDVTAGTKLVCDGGFTCIAAGSTLEVQASDTGNLYVPCRHGRHYLDGQTDDDGVIVGLSLAENSEA